MKQKDLLYKFVYHKFSLIIKKKIQQFFISFFVKLDINQMAVEIATINSLSLEDLKINLVCEWLETNKSEDADMVKIILAFLLLYIFQYFTLQ